MDLDASAADAARVQTQMDRVLLHNGKIWTPSLAADRDGEDLAMDRHLSSWIVLHGPHVEQVGRGPVPKDVEAGCADATDLQGRCVLPGLVDAHIHVYALGEAMHQVNLARCTTVAQIQAAIRAEAAANPAQAWIVGVGFDHERLEGKQFPTREELDAAEAARPVFIYRECYHVGVANTKALAIAHVALSNRDGSYVAPTFASGGGGDVVYDAETGGATGLLRESAVELVADHIKETDPALRVRNYVAGLQQCVKHGVTHVQTNDFSQPDAWGVYSKMHADGDLPVRVTSTPGYDDVKAAFGPAAAAAGAAGGDAPAPVSVPAPVPAALPPAGTLTPDGMLKCDRIKIFGDGSLGAATAALRAPYVAAEGGTSATARIGSEDAAEDAAEDAERGMLINTTDDLQHKVDAAHSHGYRLEIHAIGDRAAEQVLSVLQRAPGVRKGSWHRPILTHAQVLGADLIAQMAELGVVANIQPQFTLTDAAWARRRLRPAALAHAYAWKSLLDAGVACAGGSDAPVETPEPLKGIYHAIFRDAMPAPGAAGGGGGGGGGAPTVDTSQCLAPAQCLTLREAIDLYTVGGSFADKREGTNGVLAPGYVADLVVLTSKSGDVFANPALFHAAAVDRVIVHGARKYDRPKSSRGAAPVAPPCNPAAQGKAGYRRPCKCCRGRYTFTSPRLRGRGMHAPGSKGETPLTCIFGAQQ